MVLLRCALAVLCSSLAAINPYLLPSDFIYPGLISSLVVVVLLCIDSAVRHHWRFLASLLVLMVVTMCEAAVLMMRLRNSHASPSFAFFHMFLRCGWVLRTILLSRYILEPLPRSCRKLTCRDAESHWLAPAAGTHGRGQAAVTHVKYILLALLFVGPSVLSWDAVSVKPICWLVDSNSTITMDDLVPLDSHLLSISTRGRAFSTATPEGRPLFTVECATHYGVTACTDIMTRAVGECCFLAFSFLCITGLLWLLHHRDSEAGHAVPPSIELEASRKVSTSIELEARPPSIETRSRRSVEPMTSLDAASSSADYPSFSGRRAMDGHHNNPLKFNTLLSNRGGGKPTMNIFTNEKGQQQRAIEIRSDQTFGTSSSTSSTSPAPATFTQDGVVPFFLQKVSHELRTPMAITLTSLDALAKSSLSGSQLDLVKSASSSTEIGLQHIGALVAWGDLPQAIPLKSAWFDVQVCSCSQGCPYGTGSFFCIFFV